MNRVAIDILNGCAAVLVLGLLLVPVIPFIVLGFSNMLWLPTIIVGKPVAVGGYVAARPSRKPWISGLMTGLIVGVIVFAILTLLDDEYRSFLFASIVVSSASALACIGVAVATRVRSRATGE